MWTSFSLHEQTCHRHPFLNTIDPLLAVISHMPLFQITAGRFYIFLLSYKTITVFSLTDSNMLWVWVPVKWLWAQHSQARGQML